mmetsp:Transcript_39068/g.91253  ORF Transcript_39068/g.91253 Transcript_39068/m.91253 type:complete len:414 (+) Transcript_39068:194-1435(+)
MIVYSGHAPGTTRPRVIGFPLITSVPFPLEAHSHPPPAPLRLPSLPTPRTACSLDLGLTDLRHGLCGDNLGVRVVLLLARSLCLLDLVQDPWGRLLEALLKGDARRPPKHLLDEIIVAVASTHSLGARNVLDWHLALAPKVPTDAHGHISHLVHRDHLIRPDVERLLVVARHDPQQALDCVVNVTERPCLVAVTPHLKLFGGGESLAEEGSGSLLAATVPGTVGTVDVVKADDAELDLGKVNSVPAAALLRDKLLETVGILRVRGPGVRLLKARVRGVELLVLGVDAGRRGVEEALDAALARGLHHVEGDHGVVVQDARVVALDEAHAAHVSSEIEHPVRTLDNLEAVVEGAEVDEMELIAELLLLKVLLLLPVRPDDVAAHLLEPHAKMRPDKATGPGDEDLGSRSRHFPHG